MKILISDYDSTFNPIYAKLSIQRNTKAIENFRKKGNIFILSRTWFKALSYTESRLVNSWFLIFKGISSALVRWFSFSINSFILVFSYLQNYYLVVLYTKFLNIWLLIDVFCVNFILRRINLAPEAVSCYATK